MRRFAHALFALGASALMVGAPLGATTIQPTPPETTTGAAPVASPRPVDASTAVITGTVKDTSTGRPVPAVMITAVGGGSKKSTSTAADGTFRLSLLPGVYVLDADRGGFESGESSSITAVAGTATDVALSIAEADISSLKTIGRVSTSTRLALNTSVTATSTLDRAQLAERELPNLNDSITELPGVTISRTTGATANTFFAVRGAEIETRTNIDGHPVSVGTFGAYNVNYAIADIFQSVDVLKGAGLNGPTAGESVFGTINLRTRDFESQNHLFVKGGVDNYDGTFYSVYGNANFFKGKLSVLAGKSFVGYRGPWYGYTANRVGINTGIPSSTLAPPNFTGLLNWSGDLSNTEGLQGELAKLRFRFSNSTSVSFEYLGLQGQYIPQGGSYASYEGHQTVAPCYNGAVPARVATACGVLSQYNAPYLSGLIGHAVDSYSWFPSSYVQNNEPYFSAEFRTSLKNDTFLVRPYTAEINRFISGDRENLYPGNNGGWTQVTNSANCQSTFIAPTAATGGAKGPCFGSNFVGPTGPSYIGASNPAGVVYSTTATNPNCSRAAPCYTTPTGVQNDGNIGYGTPFSQPEIDRLHGVTFEYLHPTASNNFGFSYEYNADDTSSRSNDTTPAPAGCTNVVGGGVQNTPAAAGLGYQPTCNLASAALISAANPRGLFLPQTAISIPATIVRKNEFALTDSANFTDKFQGAFGLYYTAFHANPSSQDPALIARYAAARLPNAAPQPLTAAPVSLVSTANVIYHLDPHIGFQYKVNPDLSIRMNGGSGVTLPYASVISGLGSISLPNGANNNQYTISLPNAALRNETTIAYDIGFDQRMPSSGILSVDAYDNTVHNFFANVTTAIPMPGGAVSGANGYFLSQNINAPIGRYYGLEASLIKSPLAGFGYILTGSLERAYLDQLPASIYVSGANTLVNGKQLDGSVNSQASIPYAKGYGEINYRNLGGARVSFGATYEGANNSYYSPAVVLMNGSVAAPVAHGVFAQISVQNLANVNQGTALGRAIFNQGEGSLTQQLNPQGQIVGGATRTKSLQFVTPNTLRFSLAHDF